ncbi:MAG TPA: hypothetical protein VIR57_23935 [Chloroflexota bacterium]|jgi:hypothetical protein
MKASAAPPQLVGSLPQAKEVILCIANDDLGDALDLLQRHVSEPYRVQVIWNHSNLQLLEALLRRGYHVFEGAVDGPNRLFAGRSLGYQLPSYESIPHPYEMSYRDWWRRIGTFLLMSGAVGKIYPEQQLFQLKDRDHFFISVASSKLPLPEPGTEVDVLVNCPWASSRTLLASAKRILVKSPAGSVA